MKILNKMFQNSSIIKKNNKNNNKNKHKNSKHNKN